MANILIVLGHSILLSSLLATSHCILKWVSMQEYSSYINLLKEFWLVIGFSLSIYVFIFFYYIFILKSNPISILYPTYTGLSIIFVLILAHFIFKETINFNQLLGVVFTIIGVFLTTLKI